MMYDEVVIQDRAVSELQEHTPVKLTCNGIEQLAVVHRVHPEDGTVTVQLIPSQERHRVSAMMCQRAFQPLEFPPMRLEPGERLPTPAQAEKAYYEACDNLQKRQTALHGMATINETEAGYHATGNEDSCMGTSVESFNDVTQLSQTPPGAPALQASATMVFGPDDLDSVTPKPDQPPPPPDSDSDTWSRGLHNILERKNLEARQPRYAEKCPTQFLDDFSREPPPPPMMLGGSTQHFGDGTAAAFQASAIFSDEVSAAPAMNQPVSARIMAEPLNEQNVRGVKTLLDDRWGMPAPTQYALYRRGLPKEQLSTEYGEHMYSNLYRRQHHQFDAPEEQQPSYLPGTMYEGKRITQHTVIPLEGPSYTLTSTGHRNYEIDEGPNSVKSNFGWLDGGFANKDDRIAGSLDSWFDGLFS